MNPLWLITLPARLGYEVARRTLDVAAVVGRKVGLFGESQAEPVAAEPRPTPHAVNGDAPARDASASPTTAAAPDTAPVADAPTSPRTAPSSLPSEDVELIRKVETEVLRDTASPEFAVDVNPIGGVVKLSGRAESTDHVRELQRRALSVPGVKRVENELSVPDTPAPGPFNAERHRPDAEPLPKDLAERGEGRQPAPLGADDSQTSS
jgi:BON domain